MRAPSARTGSEGFTWVASPPHGTRRDAPRRAGLYRGPPAYPAPPRWGFPQLAWRVPTRVPGTADRGAQPAERVRSTAYSALIMLALTATVAAVATGSEIWRYVLLLRSRDHLLSSGVVGASDTLTDVTGVLAIVFALLAASFCVLWLRRARLLASETFGQRPVRSDWQALAGPFVPGVNLVLPFSVLAELEHTALERDPRARPRPSRLLLCWWAMWVIGALLFLITLVWNQFGGVQALADGVVVHAVLDASAVAVAVSTGLVVWRLTLLLAPHPERANRFSYVLRIAGAPEPTERAPRPAGAAR